MMRNCSPAAPPADVRIAELDENIIGICVRRPACDRWFCGRYDKADKGKGIQAEDERGAAWCKANCHG